MLIVSLTTWYKRVLNLPTVIDSILSNTILPDKIVVNLSEEDFPNRELPESVSNYLSAYHFIEFIWHKDNMKVYKKFLPTLKKYPDATIITADDDRRYPMHFIETLLKAHKQYPNNPISGNYYYMHGIKYHCGAASLVEARFLEGWEEYYNLDFLQKCPADDVFYTWLALKNGYLYKPAADNFDSFWYVFNEDGRYTTSGEYNIRSEQYMYDLFGYQIDGYLSDDSKPLCIFGVMNIPRGLDIEKEMLEWLTPSYNVLIVRHNGEKFEYPALKFMQDFVNSSNYRGPILYVHTKGAYYVRRDSQCVRNMWKYEFTTPERQKLYLDAVNTQEPTLATPYQGILTEPRPGIPNEEYPSIVPWLNGWIANAEAVKLMQIVPSDNRYTYETGIYKGINIVGIREKDVNTSIEESRNRMYSDIAKF